MDKKVIFTGIVSLCSAKAAWQELGREFKYGDDLSGKVGLMSTVGRFGIKASAAILAYVITDACISWTLKGISDAIKESKMEEAETEAEEDSDDESDLDGKVEEDD